MPAELTESRANSCRAFLDRLLHPPASLWAGLFLLLVSFGAGYSLRFAGIFGDEADNLAAGVLMRGGDLLYRDIFSHHFPFAYLWTAAVFRFFEPSIETARLALLLFQLLVFAIVMLVTRQGVLLGLAALLWTTIGHFYQANVVLYQSLGVILVMPVFCVVLFSHLGLYKLNWKGVLLISIFSALALLTNPLFILVVGLSMVFLALQRPPLKQILAVLGLIAAILGLYLAYLLATHTLDDFVQGAIYFNRVYYARYSASARPEHLLTVLKSPFSLYNILNPKFSMQPIFVLQRYEPAFVWQLSEKFYKIVILLLSLALLFSRRWWGGTYLYLFTSAFLVRGFTSFDQLPLLMVAVCSLPLLALTPWLSAQAAAAARLPAWLAANCSRIRLGFAVVFGLTLTWSLAFGYFYIRDNREWLTYQANFGPELRMSEQMLEYACGQEALLGYYPGNPYVYFFSGMRPISGYLYLWPWVANAGLDDILTVIKDPQVKAVVFLDSESKVWGISASQYLERLSIYLESSYVNPQEKIYLSPALAEACGWSK